MSGNGDRALSASIAVGFAQDWPLSREEKKTRVLTLFKREAQIQQASEDLVEQETRLVQIAERQDELLFQLDRVSLRLQDKIHELPQDSCRLEYQQLQAETSSVISLLESFQDSLADDVGRAKSKLESEVSGLKKELKVSLASRHALRAKLRYQEHERAAAEEKLTDVSAALSRTQVQERQAVEQAQRCRTALQIRREFGGDIVSIGSLSTQDSLAQESRDDGIVGRESTASSARFDLDQDVRSSSSNPSHAEARDSGVTSNPAVGDDNNLEPALSSVLIAIELDLGPNSGKATLSVAPWQTLSDFDDIVQDFLNKHRVKHIFANALVQYLEEVESQAATFPAIVTADLADLYSRFG